MPDPAPAASDSILVGRARELATLRAALAAAVAGRGSLVLIGGEAGIGKTALAEALLAEAADQGALVLVGRCYDLSETPPYGPWAEAFARAPGGDGLPALPAAVLSRARADEAFTSQDAIVARVRDYLVALAVSLPVVLLLDDLHWADPASLDLLRVVARGLGDQSVLLLATYRADELTRRHPLAQLLPSLVREARAVRLDLRRLEVGALRLLVRRYGLSAPDEDRLVIYLDARAEGNPFFAGELVRTLEEDRTLWPAAVSGTAEAGWHLGDLTLVGMPPLLGQVIDARLDRLGEMGRDLLATAAIIGQEVPSALWQAASGADEETLAGVMEAALMAHLLLPTAGGARFAHALIREALYAGLVPPRRRVRHNRVAEALLATPDPDPDAVAYHLQRAGDDRAAAWLVRAGERAQRAYAWLLAADRYEAALALTVGGVVTARERMLLLLTLAQLRRYADPARGVAYLDEALGLAEAAGEAALAACARFDHGHLRCLTSDVRRGLAEMAVALPTLEALPSAERARLPTLRLLGIAPEEPYHRGALVMHLANAGRFAEAAALGETLPMHGSGATARGLTGLGLVHAYSGRPEAARQYFAAGRALYRAAGQQVEVHHSIFLELFSVAHPYDADRPTAWGPLIAEADAIAARASLTQAELGQGTIAAVFQVLHGAWAEARRFFFPPTRALVHGLLGRYQGDALAAWAAIRQILPEGPATALGNQNLPHAFPLLPLAAGLALDADDLATARAWLATHDRWLTWSGAVLGQADGALGWAAYHRAAGSLALAREQGEAALTLATEPRQPLALLQAHRLLGELDTATGHPGAAQAHLDTARALAEACAAPYERALTLLEIAALYLATGERDRAMTAEQEARLLLVPLEARPALARADALATRLAVPPTPPAPAVLPFGLTTREAEVLRLAARGRTSAEIADHLFITPRTVAAHLTAIYSKLGVENRAAAIRLALDHDLR